MPGMSEKFNNFGREEIEKVFEEKPDLELTNRDDDLEESIDAHNLIKGKESLIEKNPISKNINEGEILMLNDYGEKQKQFLTSLYGELYDFVTAIKTENYPKDRIKGIGETVFNLLSDCDTNLSIQAAHHYRENNTGIEVLFSSNDSIKKDFKDILEKEPKDLSPEDFAFLDKLETIVYGAKMQFSKFLERQSQEN